jgi:hypothetical protein
MYYNGTMMRHDGTMMRHDGTMMRHDGTMMRHDGTMLPSVEPRMYHKTLEHKGEKRI